MFQILAHPNLPHHPILVPINPRQLPHMRKHVLQPIRQLERIDVPKPELDMRVDDEFGETENLSDEMEGVSETGFLSLFGGEGFDGFEVEVVVEVEVVEVLQ